MLRSSPAPSPNPGVDSSIFRRGSTNETCHFCVHEVDNDRRFLCLAYECFVLLDTVCDSYERRV